MVVAIFTSPLDAASHHFALLDILEAVVPNPRLASLVLIKLVDEEVTDSTVGSLVHTSLHLDD